MALKEYLVKIKSNTLEDIIELDSLATGRRQIAELCKQARISILNKTKDENTALFMSSGWAFIDLYFNPSNSVRVPSFSSPIGRIETLASQRNEPSCMLPSQIPM